PIMPWATSTTLCLLGAAVSFVSGMQVAVLVKWLPCVAWLSSDLKYCAASLRTIIHGLRPVEELNSVQGGKSLLLRRQWKKACVQEYRLDDQYCGKSSPQLLP